MGLPSACHRAQPRGEAEVREFHCAYSMPPSGQVLGCREARGMASGVGKHSLRHGKARVGWESLGLQRGWGRGVLRLLDIQAPLEVTEELRMESGPKGWV